MIRKLFKIKEPHHHWWKGLLAGITTSLTLLWIVLNIEQLHSIPLSKWTNLFIPSLVLFTFAIYLLLVWANIDKRVSQARQLIAEKKYDEAWKLLHACIKQKKLLPLLYELATAFKDVKQFDDVLNVYEFIAEYDPDYRDVREQIKQHKNMQETLMFGASESSSKHHLKIENGSSDEPMLGRYLIQKELGKGAMGIVYLGKDPKINRVVAIKTMALSQEFEEDEIDAVKERFFREAETAGRLTHPNIVTIYDVGEEDELAYISMEFLDGHDLTCYTSPDKLLPIKTVVQLVVLASEALNYAHNQKVVHRDIKPANVMLIPALSTIKLTDFGIARITDSSKTKTGLVLGTPSYMSPEQLVGKHIDGRSDLFSLGVMLYQLLTGRLPFKGDSMASLMFCIANEPHPEIIGVRKELKKALPEISNIINRILEKTPEKRYQTGEELAKDLRNCLKNIKK
jgi:eukaryotic-like serine/threonine-protein kinase